MNLEEIAKKHNMSKEDLINRVTVSHIEYDEIGLVDEYRENDLYYWIIRIHDKFYKVLGAYSSHEGISIIPYDLQEVKKVLVTKEEWIDVA